jgi:hypothetical protein
VWGRIGYVARLIGMSLLLINQVRSCMGQGRISDGAGTVLFFSGVILLGLSLLLPWPKGGMFSWASPPQEFPRYVKFLGSRRRTGG